MRTHTLNTLAALALGLSANAWAAPVEIDLPAQPLADALVRFGQETGLKVAFSQSEVAGRQAPAVQGRLEPQQALAQLLAGSGLNGSLQGGIASVSATEPDAMQLQSVNVTGQADVAGSAITEGSRSYTTGAMQTATKLNMSVRETPQSVTVITRQRMDDQAMNNLNDVVKNTTGVTLQKYGPERQRFVARGFTVDNIMYDGLPTSLSTYTQDVISAADMAMYDRVEIVRGATGLMQGAGNPAAAINLVRKRPTVTPQASVTGSAGTWDSYRTELDVSGALNDSGSLRGRVVGAYQDKDSYQDVGESQRGLLYAIGEADLTDATTLTVGASYQNDNKGSDWGGLPTARDGSDLHLSRSAYMGSDWAYWDTTNTFLFSELEHRFDNGWKMRLAGSKLWGRIDMLGSYLGYSGDTLTQGSGRYIYTNDHDSYDAYASGPFQLLGRTHELVIGASNREESFDGHGGFGTTSTNFDPFRWDSGSVAKPNYYLRGWGLKTDAEQNGVYATARLNLADPLKVILGSRLDWYDYEGENMSNNVTKPQNGYTITRNVTRYAGVIYDLNDTYSVYASYTDIFKPQNNVDISGEVIEPMTGKNYEVGLKGAYFDGALNASAALFQVDQENRAKLLDDQAFNCPGYPAVSCYEAAGKVRSQGIDMELTGALTDHWQLSAGYTYVEAKYKKDTNKANEGKLFDTDQPRHLFKLSTTYTLPGDLERWRVGGSLNAQNAIYNEGGAGSSAWRVEQDAYTLVDMMVGYKVSEHVDTRLNLNNVLDKRYYSGIGGNTNMIYGEPRNAMLTVKWSL
ncbi:TonB-dependent siderophore receptor [Pseudomonas sp. RIT-PI-AD]|uniref:TonB-dependent siderophore receptor n=1 Tax=Pseudomonas sp. RIT-PI-AD TaxID=3035294 RepID=UPI0021DB18D9|nr:TonB-dependent siderophore receptor [Pseudomonas sp. RIT-PI-AD]